MSPLFTSWLNLHGVMESMLAASSDDTMLRIVLGVFSKKVKYRRPVALLFSHFIFPALTHLERVILVTPNTLQVSRDDNLTPLILITCSSFFFVTKLSQISY